MTLNEYLEEVSNLIGRALTYRETQRISLLYVYMVKVEDAAASLEA